MLQPPCYKFQSTLPARGATYFPLSLHPQHNHFNPRSPHGERHAPQTHSKRTEHFNPRSPHGERLTSSAWLRKRTCISIHAPRTGSDARRSVARAGWRYFNPRSPHGERLVLLVNVQTVEIFQSTLPARGATGRGTPHGFKSRFQSTLPARGATTSSRARVACISFQSTLPARGATAFPARRCSFLSISIHAPRTGSDAFRNVPNARVIISIHAPRTGSDTPARLVFCLRFSFQSTLPARGATRRRSDTARIQIKFQSTLPARGATISLFGAFVKPTISIHAPRTGSDKRDR